MHIAILTLIAEAHRVAKAGKSVCYAIESEFTCE